MQPNFSMRRNGITNLKQFCALFCETSAYNALKVKVIFHKASWLQPTRHQAVCLLDLPAHLQDLDSKVLLLARLHLIMVGIPIRWQWRLHKGRPLKHYNRRREACL